LDALFGGCGEHVSTINFQVFSWYFMVFNGIFYRYFDGILMCFGSFVCHFSTDRATSVLGIGTRQRRWAHPAATDSTVAPVPVVPAEDNLEDQPR